MAYTTIDDPSAYFQAALYSGTGATQSITNDGNSDLQPDLVWIKQRSGTEDHLLFDSTRGTEQALKSNSDAAEFNYNSSMTAFNSDGFSLGTANGVNGTGTFVGWQWKANAGSTSSNTSGTLTSTIQSDTTAGFCIATYTGNGTTGATYGHNLGVAPDIMFTKNRTSGSTNWSVDGSIAGLTYGTNKLVLSDGSAISADTNNVTGASSTLITVGNGANCNQNTSSHVAYLFAQKQGYSKFGSYTGNGNANGAFVYTGFKPAFLIIKVTDDARDWRMYDAKRDTFNVVEKYLTPNTTSAEGTTSTLNIDFLSNGFKLRGNHVSTNQSGKTFLYMAFAENPFVTSTGIPTTAR